MFQFPRPRKSLILYAFLFLIIIVTSDFYQVWGVIPRSSLNDNLENKVPAVIRGPAG